MVMCGFRCASPPPNRWSVSPRNSASTISSSRTLSPRTSPASCSSVYGMSSPYLFALSFQRAIPGGQLGEGAAIAVAMIPFLLAAILFSFFGLQRRKWQQGND